ncbi:MAG: extracellular solute-binding protein [Chloroflexota bacterium]|nr:extracellular solute-binding protein [Chloroflexota bacterium]
MDPHVAWWGIARRASVVVTAGLIVGCGGGGNGTAAATASPTTVAGLAAYHGADRQQLLEAGARKEGTLTFYSGPTSDVNRALADAFQAKYPFITKVDIFGASETDLINRATTEANAGQPSFDVVESPPTTTIVLTENKLTARYFSPSLAGIPDELKSGLRDGLVDSTTVRLSYVGFGLNTKLIPESAAPKTLQDLLNPALAGKIAIAGSTTGKRWLGSVLHALGPDKGKAFLQQFATQQKPTVQQVSGRALLDLIAKGEVPASTTIYSSHVAAAVSKSHAPVQWIPIDPVVANVDQLALAARSPHPNAALLFIDFIMGPDGQKIFPKYGYDTPGEKPSFSVWIPEVGKSSQQIQQEVKDWDQLFKTLFR